jgi:hypothetical protein
MVLKKIPLVQCTVYNINNHKKIKLKCLLKINTNLGLNVDYLVKLMILMQKHLFLLSIVVMTLFKSMRQQKVILVYYKENSLKEEDISIQEQENNLMILTCKWDLVLKFVNGDSN